MAHTNTRFNQNLTFPLALADLPRDTRVCFSVYAHEDGGKVRALPLAFRS